MEQLDAYIEDCRRFARDQFAAAHPHPWLVIVVREDTSSWWRSFRTISVSNWNITKSRDDLPVAAGGYRVLKVVKTADNPWRDRISFGRARNNDVVIRDRSVSKLHAHISIDERGRVTLRDTGSRNGTRVNGNRVRVKDAVVLVSGDEICFGRFDTTYHDTLAFYDFLREITEQEATG